MVKKELESKVRILKNVTEGSEKEVEFTVNHSPYKIRRIKTFCGCVSYKRRKIKDRDAFKMKIRLKVPKIPRHLESLSFEKNIEIYLSENSFVTLTMKGNSIKKEK